MKKNYTLIRITTRRNPFNLFTLLTSLLLFQMLGMPTTLNSQDFPWNAASVPVQFGLEDLPARSTFRFVDFDNDGTLEAYVIEGSSSAPDFKYFKNEGSNALPDFVYFQSYPFGLPQGLYYPWEYVDIDGDCDLDVFLVGITDPDPLAYLENKGTPEMPWFGDSQVEINPFGFVQPTSDSIPNQFLGGLAYSSFVDIDADNDYDLFYGGNFAQPDSPIFDENFYFYRNVDPSGMGTSPQFEGPIKNPFNLTPPAEVPDAIIISRFVDMDCDGDWDLFATYAGILIAYYENTGSPTAPHFSDAPIVWWANTPPAPPGFNAFLFGDWIDIVGDGDMDFITGGGGGNFFMENISDGTLACQGPIPEYEQCIINSTKESYLDASLLLYPNPARDLMTFDLQSNEPLEEIDIEIFDLTGQKVKRLSLQSFDNILKETISLKGLPIGVYNLKVNSDGKFVARKFIKM